VRDPFTAIYQLRQRYVSDRTWYGVALFAVGLAIVTETGSALRWVGLLPMIAGTVIAYLGVTRAICRSDPATGETRPSPPW